MGRSPLAIDCTARYKRDNANVLRVGGCQRAWRPTEYLWLIFGPWRTPFGAGHAGFTI